MKHLDVRSNTFWMLFANVSYAASQWLVVILLSKYETAIAIGQFALARAIINPIIMFSNLQLRAVYSTDAKKEFTFAEYFGTRIVSTSFAFIVTIIFILFSGYKQQTNIIIFAVMLTKVAESGSDIVYGNLQRVERMNRIAIPLSAYNDWTLTP